jgi:hypothetical protein
MVVAADKKNYISGQTHYHETKLNEVEIQAVHYNRKEQVLKLDEQATQAFPSVVGLYPAKKEQTLEAKVNREK